MYRRPISAPRIVATSELPPPAELAAFRAALLRSGKASLAIRGTVRGRAAEGEADRAEAEARPACDYSIVVCAYVQRDQPPTDHAGKGVEV